MKGADNYGFIRKLLETIKQTEDANEPNAPEASKVGRGRRRGRRVGRGRRRVGHLQRGKEGRRGGRSV